MAFFYAISMGEKTHSEILDLKETFNMCFRSFVKVHIV